MRIIDASEFMMKDLVKFSSVNESILAQSEDIKKFKPKDFKIVSKKNLINLN